MPRRSGRGGPLKDHDVNCQEKSALGVHSSPDEKAVPESHMRKLNAMNKMITNQKAFSKIFNPR